MNDLSHWALPPEEDDLSQWAKPPETDMSQWATPPTTAVLDERHPDIGVMERSVAKSWSTPQGAQRYLESKGFEVQPAGGHFFNVRKPGEADWRKIDPDKFELEDVTDVLPDVAEATYSLAGGVGGNVLGGLVGGPVGSVLGGGVGAALTTGIAQGGRTAAGYAAGVPVGIGEDLPEVAKNSAIAGAADMVGTVVGGALGKVVGPAWRFIAPRIFKRLATEAGEAGIKEVAEEVTETVAQKAASTTPEAGPLTAKDFGLGENDLLIDAAGEVVDPSQATAGNRYFVFRDQGQVGQLVKEMVERPGVSDEFVAKVQSGDQAAIEEAIELFLRDVPDHEEFMIEYIKNGTPKYIEDYLQGKPGALPPEESAATVMKGYPIGARATTRQGMAKSAKEQNLTDEQLYSLVEDYYYKKHPKRPNPVPRRLHEATRDQMLEDLWKNQGTVNLGKGRQTWMGEPNPIQAHEIPLRNTELGMGRHYNSQGIQSILRDGGESISLPGGKNINDLTGQQLFEEGATDLSYLQRPRLEEVWRRESGEGIADVPINEVTGKPLDPRMVERGGRFYQKESVHPRTFRTAKGVSVADQPTGVPGVGRVDNVPPRFQDLAERRTAAMNRRGPSPTFIDEIAGYFGRGIERTGGALARPGRWIDEKFAETASNWLGHTVSPTTMNRIGVPGGLASSYISGPVGAAALGIKGAQGAGYVLEKAGRKLARNPTVWAREQLFKQSVDPKLQELALKILALEESGSYFAVRAATYIALRDPSIRAALAE